MCLYLVTCVLTLPWNIALLHPVLVGYHTFQNAACDVERIHNFIWFSYPAFKKRKRLFSEEFCIKQLFGSTSAEFFSCISVYKVASSVLFLMNFWVFCQGRCTNFVYVPQKKYDWILEWLRNKNSGMFL